MSERKETVKDLASILADLQACHEYYCKYNCGTLVKLEEHTPRCQRLQETYGFLPVEKARVRLQPTETSDE